MTLKPKILVTGGCGYIGAHTIVDLLENGFDVVSVDNLSRADARLLKGIQKITGREVHNHTTDLCDRAATEAIFKSTPGLEGIIHFAAFKTVPESVAHPLRYYHNNLVSQINLLDCVKKFDIPGFVFSSSCSVYGDTDHLPVDEDTPAGHQASPYGRTKRMGEQMCEDFAAATDKPCLSLRYFNPVGAHPSGHIGEVPHGKPENLVPILVEVANGVHNKLTVYGDDYDTRDGTCIRDYIHVMDIAHAHTLALKYLLDSGYQHPHEIFNLGTGKGVTVLEAIRAFEKATGEQLKYTTGDRRPGDVAAIYADNRLAKEKLGWQPAYSIEEMMGSAWKWAQETAER